MYKKNISEKIIREKNISGKSNLGFGPLGWLI